jgi:hypothetical protein
MSIAPRVLAAAGAMVMPASLFFYWYEVNTGDSIFKIKGWDAFESTDTLMVMAALATLALLMVNPRHAGRLMLLVGAAISGWILVQLIDRPATLGFFDSSDLSVKVGAALGLFGALSILVAGALATIPRDRPMVE